MSRIRLDRPDGSAGPRPAAMACAVTTTTSATTTKTGG